MTAPKGWHVALTVVHELEELLERFGETLTGVSVRESDSTVISRWEAENSPQSSFLLTACTLAVGCVLPSPRGQRAGHGTTSSTSGEGPDGRWVSVNCWGPRCPPWPWVPLPLPSHRGLYAVCLA